MIREALQYIVNLGQVKTIEVDGFTYSPDRLNRITEPTVSESFRLSTLQGVVDYINEEIDTSIVGQELIVQIANPKEVNVYSALGIDKERELLVNAVSKTPSIEFNRFMDVENFNIMLQSCFEPTDHQLAMLKIVGNLKEEIVKNVGDDGVSQKVTAKTGIARVEDVVLPNPVVLKPHRTFPEIEQPESKYIFRMQSGPSAALFEAGGTMWRVEAMERIKQYLSDNINDSIVKHIKIIV